MKPTDTRSDWNHRSGWGILLIAGLLGLLGLSGCSGGDSSSGSDQSDSGGDSVGGGGGSSADPGSLQGRVVDGPITGATLVVLDAEGNTITQKENATDPTGRFQLQLPDGAEPARIEVKKGEYSQTRNLVDEYRSEDSGDRETIVISPLSHYRDRILQTRGAEEAQRALAALGLETDPALTDQTFPKQLRVIAGLKMARGLTRESSPQKVLAYVDQVLSMGKNENLAESINEWTPNAYSDCFSDSRSSFPKTVNCVADSNMAGASYRWRYNGDEQQGQNVRWQVEEPGEVELKVTDPSGATLRTADYSIFGPGEVVAEDTVNLGDQENRSTIDKTASNTNTADVQVQAGEVTLIVPEPAISGGTELTLRTREGQMVEDSVAADDRVVEMNTDGQVVASSDHPIRLQIPLSERQMALANQGRLAFEKKGEEQRFRIDGQLDRQAREVSIPLQSFSAGQLVTVDRVASASDFRECLDGADSILWNRCGNGLRHFMSQIAGANSEFYTEQLYNKNRDNFEALLSREFVRGEPAFKTLLRLYNMYTVAQNTNHAPASNDHLLPTADFFEKMKALQDGVANPTKNTLSGLLGGNPVWQTVIAGNSGTLDKIDEAVLGGDAGNLESIKRLGKVAALFDVYYGLSSDNPKQHIDLISGFRRGLGGPAAMMAYWQAELGKELIDAIGRIEGRLERVTAEQVWNDCCASLDPAEISRDELRDTIQSSITEAGFAIEPPQVLKAVVTEEQERNAQQQKDIAKALASPLAKGVAEGTRNYYDEVLGSSFSFDVRGGEVATGETVLDIHWNIPDAWPQDARGWAQVTVTSGNGEAVTKTFNTEYGDQAKVKNQWSFTSADLNLRALKTSQVDVKFEARIERRNGGRYSSYSDNKSVSLTPVPQLPSIPDRIGSKTGVTSNLRVDSKGRLHLENLRVQNGALRSVVENQNGSVDVNLTLDELKARTEKGSPELIFRNRGKQGLEAGWSESSSQIVKSADGDGVGLRGYRAGEPFRIEVTGKLELQYQTESGRGVGRSRTVSFNHATETSLDSNAFVDTGARYALQYFEPVLDRAKDQIEAVYIARELGNLATPLKGKVLLEDPDGKTETLLKGIEAGYSIVKDSFTKRTLESPVTLSGEGEYRLIFSPENSPEHKKIRAFDFEPTSAASLAVDGADISEGYYYTVEMCAEGRGDVVAGTCPEQFTERRLHWGFRMDVRDVEAESLRVLPAEWEAQLRNNSGQQIDVPDDAGFVTVTGTEGSAARKVVFAGGGLLLLRRGEDAPEQTRAVTLDGFQEGKSDWAQGPEPTPDHFPNLEDYRTDEDGDGLPDAWEREYFGDLKKGAHDDPDEDGLTNIEEFYGAGVTSPDEQATAGDLMKTRPDNGPPDVGALSLRGKAGEVLTGTLKASDPEGDNLSYSLRSQPAHGTVSFPASGEISYTPGNGDFTGEDSFAVRVTDAFGNAAMADVGVVVEAGNRAPSVDDETITVPAGKKTEDALSASDPDGDPVTYTHVSGSGPEHGSVSVAPNGSYTFSAESGYTGTDSFSYQVQDGNGGTDTAQVTVDVVSPKIGVLTDVAPSRLLTGEEAKIQVEVRQGKAPYEIKLEWGDGAKSEPSLQNREFSTYTHIYGKQGSYQPTVTVTDALDRTYADTLRLTVSDEPAETTSWTAQVNNMDTAEGPYGVNLQVVERTFGDSKVETYTTDAQLPDGDRAFVRHSLALPAGLFDLENKMRVTAIVKAGNRAYYDRELSVTTPARKFKANIVDPAVKSAVEANSDERFGVFRVKNLVSGSQKKITRDDDVGLESFYRDAFPGEPSKAQGLALELDGSTVSVQSYSEGEGYQELYQYSSTNLGDYLREVGLTYLGEGTTILAVLEVDKDGDGRYGSDQSETTLLTTPNKSVSWEKGDGSRTGDESGLITLNDTGVDWCTDDTYEKMECPANGYPNQDAQNGRDVDNGSDSDGVAGFSFTKISESGEELSPEATEWSCVRDNVTGLVWETKTASGGLRDKENTYSWYNSDETTNGGSAGVVDGGACTGGISCDTESYVKEINKAGLCGYSDWYLPTTMALASIINNGTSKAPVIDGMYFPNASYGYYWTKVPSASDASEAWHVGFNAGYTGSHKKKSQGLKVRLVTYPH